MDRVSVRNAASPQQVKRAERRERAAVEAFSNALIEVLSTPAGRVVLWGLLERAGVFKSIWSPNAEIHYKAGRQDFGHEMMTLILETSESLYLEMETEARARARKTNAEIDAAHTPASTE